jgi:hypothetical protein
VGYVTVPARGSPGIRVGPGAAGRGHDPAEPGRDGKLAEVWHQEDAPGMLRQLGLEPPTTIMRLAARRSARRYRRELAATR